MSNNIQAIFYDHSSYKSLLTNWSDKDLTDSGPRSIAKLAKDNGLDKLIFVSNSFSTFIEALKNCKKNGIQLVFGLELWLCDDAKIHDEESKKTEHKIIILMKNSKGYQDLVKIYSAMNLTNDNFYYKPRFDLAQLKPLWTDNLGIILPFFDSFIARNTTKFGATIVPAFPCAPVLCREQEPEHPHEQVINLALDDYNKNGDHQEIKTKTIFYEKESDFLAYTTYRCMKNRSSVEDPKLDWFCSPKFSFESYLSLAK